MQRPVLEWMGIFYDLSGEKKKEINPPSDTTSHLRKPPTQHHKPYITNGIVAQYGISYIIVPS